MLGLGACAETQSPPTATLAAPSSPTIRAATPSPTATRTPKPTATFVPLITPSATPEIPRISMEEALPKLVAGEAVLVDVRAAAVYETEHAAGALSLPAHEVETRWGELPTGKLLIFYCDCGNESRSGEAALTVIGHGLADAVALQGGWRALLRAGYPLVAKPTDTPTATPTGPGVSLGDGVTMLGDLNAPVTIFEFSDYQCPYCRQYTAQTLSRIQEEYIDSGKVRYVFKDFPLSTHRHAQKAAEAARCAGVQGAYWEMHDLLFESQSEWSRQGQEQAVELFVEYASRLGLDSEVFADCLASGEFAQQIAQDVSEGQQLGVAGTPTFLIHGRLLVGVYPFDTFQQIIEAELESAE